MFLEEERQIIVSHIVSEPRDSTRYDYFIWINYDSIIFIPNESMMVLPQPISKGDLPKAIEVEDLIEKAKKEGCNPHTMKECYTSAAKVLRINR